MKLAFFLGLAVALTGFVADATARGGREVRDHRPETVRDHRPTSSGQAVGRGRGYERDQSHPVPIPILVAGTIQPFEINSKTPEITGQGSGLLRHMGAHLLSAREMAKAA